MTKRPLDGIRVIDFSRVLAGPLIGQLLGDLGADVIKVERPGHGDDTRTWGPPWHQPDDTDAPDATYYLSLNRNKRSIVLDLKDVEDQAFARRLAATGDIVLDNFKPGFTTELGLDRASLAVATNPAVITATITAFGAASDAAHLPGYDLVAQGMGGLMHLTGEADGRPLRVGVPLIDMFAGYNATVGVLAALAETRVTGVGRHVEVSLYDAALHALLNHQTAVLMADADPARGGNRHPSIAPYESYACSDGDIIIAAANDKLFAGLCRVIGRTDLIDDPRFEANTIRRANVHELNEIINHVLAGDTRTAWIEKLRAADVPCGPINSLPEAIDWGVDMNMETIVEGADGYRSVRNPIRLDGAAATEARRPPRLDEHADEIRAEVDSMGAIVSRRIGLFTILVPEYDDAIAHFVDDLGFELVEDTPQGDKRWVVVRPGPGAETGIVLAEATTPEQRTAMGNQLGGRVGFFLHTDDFARDHARMTAAGVHFREEPRHEPYGIVAVFDDKYGNGWDLLQPA